MKTFIHSKYSLITIVLVLSLGISAADLQAQYFGRNKVQYQKFDFKVLKTKHFDIYFYPEEQEAVEIAGRMAERWYARLSRLFNHNLKGRQPLIIYSSSPDFQQTTTISGVIGEGTGGVTEFLKQRVILPLGASLEETDHVIGHELVHAFQLSITSEKAPTYSSGSPVITQLPLWFVEGLAEYLSIGPVDANTSMWMRDAAYRKDLPEIKKLSNPRYFPYRYGQALWAFIAGKWGDDKIPSLMKSTGRVDKLETAYQKILNVSEKELGKQWHEAMKNVYDPLAKMTKVTDERSRILIKGGLYKGMNISPVLSPDGKDIVFLSSRDLFSIDMFLADAKTGKIKKKILGTAVNPKFESIQFIKSAGSWDSKGKLFAFGAISKGKPVLTLLNVEKKDIEKEIDFPELGEILNPTWSPDGNYVAFSALAGGFTDLFIYDLKSGILKRLTQDPYADLQPAWSPDGSTIAFVTDRFTTNLSILNIGNYEIAMMDPESGKIEQLPTFKNTKNINPQWSPDSKDLYFISDMNGISNIYRMNLQNKQIFQVTNFYTGVSGITALSPALSVAHDTGQLAFCVYEEGSNTVYTIDSQRALEGDPTLVRFGDIDPSILPPRQKAEGAVVGLLKNPLFGLPEETDFKYSDYKPKLGLDYVSQPSVAVGVDRYGTYAGGGLTLYWSDMLGYHTLATMAQVNGYLIDSAVLLGYLNSKNRLNWGAVVQRMPYITGGYYTGVGNYRGEPVYIEVDDIFRQINYDISGFASYPFSQMSRVEFSAGFSYIDFDREIRTQYISMIDGILLGREREKLPAPPGMSFAYAGAALIYDSSIFGATSPIIGQSFRLDVSPTLGTIRYISALADYRRYFMPVKPFTLAMRFLHYGRYGRDAEDTRLWPLFIGYEGIIRGYNYGSFKTEEFGNDPFPFDSLFGTKIMVANFELRFPLLGLLGIGKGFYGAFPVEFNAFYDVGLAWMSDDPATPDTDERAWFLGGDRKPLSSYGVGVRVYFFGLIAGLSYVHPVNRPQRGWYLQFTFTPGF